MVEAGGLKVTNQNFKKCDEKMRIPNRNQKNARGDEKGFHIELFAIVSLLIWPIIVLSIAIALQ